MHGTHLFFLVAACSTVTLEALNCFLTQSPRGWRATGLCSLAALVRCKNGTMTLKDWNGIKNKRLLCVNSLL